MRSFAKGTSVPADRTRMEIEGLLRQAGASSLGVFQDIVKGTSSVAFTLKQLNIRFDILLPKQGDRKFDEEVRRRWRCLLLILKAKLVAVADGITTIESEFLAYVVTQDGESIGRKMQPILDYSRQLGGSAPAGLALPPGKDSE